MKVPMCFVCCIVNRYNTGGRRIENGTILREREARANIQSTTFNLSFCPKAKLFKYLNVLNTWGDKLLLSISGRVGSRPQQIGDQREGKEGGWKSRYSFNNIQYSLLPNIRGLSSLPPPFRLKLCQRLAWGKFKRYVHIWKCIDGEKSSCRSFNTNSLSKF